jgi:hypothetical protein
MRACGVTRRLPLNLASRDWAAGFGSLTKNTSHLSATHGGVLPQGGSPVAYTSTSHHRVRLSPLLRNVLRCAARDYGKPMAPDKEQLNALLEKIGYE